MKVRELSLEEKHAFLTFLKMMADLDKNEPKNLMTLIGELNDKQKVILITFMAGFALQNNGLNSIGIFLANGKIPCL